MFLHMHNCDPRIMFPIAWDKLIEMYATGKVTRISYTCACIIIPYLKLNRFKGYYFVWRDVLCKNELIQQRR